MPEGLTNYILQERPIQPSLDLGILENVLSTITAGNKEALQTQSALRTAIANMDLNEAEDDFRQGLYDDITKTIEDNAIEGNAYYALDDIIKKQGDIASNPALLGRLKAQQAYKTYQTQIDARQDINQDTKDWAKALNPYHYQDKIDEKGRIIGGTEWTPIMTPVKDLDFNDILRLAAQYATPDRGGGTSVSYLGADGKPTSTPTGSIGIFSTTNGEWERLTPEKLRAAVDAAMNANPEYSASLHQAYDVLNWKWENGDKNTPLLDPTTGAKKNFNQYLDDMIDPFIRARAYNHSKSTTQYHDAAFTALNKANGSGGGKNNTLFNPGNSTLPQSQGHDIVWTDDTRQRALSQVDYIKRGVSDFLSKYNVDISMLNFKDSEGMTKYLTGLGVPTNQTASIVNYIERQYHDNYDAFNYYYDLLSQNNKAGAATIMADAISAGVRVDSELLASNPQLVKYNDKYNNIINDSFQDHDAFGFRVSNIEEYNRLLSRLGTSEEELKHLGYYILHEGKYHTIYFHRENANNLYGQFIDAVSETHRETSWWNRNVSNTDVFVRFNYGQRRPHIISNRLGDLALPVHYKPIDDYNHFIKVLNKNKDLSRNPESFLVGGTNLPGINPYQYNLQEGMYSATTKQELDFYKDKFGQSEEIINNLLNPSSYVNSTLYRVDPSNGTLTLCNSADKQIISNLLQGDASKLEKSMFYNPAAGTITPQLVYRFGGNKDNVNPFTKDKTPLTFTTDGLLLDEDIQNLNGSRDYRITSTLFKNNNNNINTDIGYYKEGNNYIHYMLTPVIGNYNGTNYRDIITDTGSLVAQNVSEQNAKDIIKLFEDIKDISYMRNGDNTTEENAYLDSVMSALLSSPYVDLIGTDIVNKMIETYSR